MMAKWCGLLLYSLITILAVRAVILWISPHSYTGVLSTISDDQQTVLAASINHNSSGLSSVAAPSINAVLGTGFDPFHPGALAASHRINHSAPETSLALELFGRRTGHQASAIIKTPDGKQGRFGIGDEIQAGVTLEAVEKDYVMISRRGTLEKLTFVQNNEKNRSFVTNTQIDANGSAIISQLGGGASLISQLDLDPARNGNKFAGYRIGPSARQGFLNITGLRKGDILTHVAQVQLLPTANSVRTVMSKAQKQSSIEVKLVRQGKPMVRMIRIR